MLPDIAVLENKSFYSTKIHQKKMFRSLFDEKLPSF